MKAVDTVVSDQHEMALGDAGMMDDVLAETEPTL